MPLWTLSVENLRIFIVTCNCNALALHLVPTGSICLFKHKHVLDRSALSPQPQYHYIPVQYLLSPRSSIALFLIVIVCHILTEHFTLQKQKFYVCKILRSCDVMMLDLNKQ